MNSKVVIVSVAVLACVVLCQADVPRRTRAATEDTSATLPNVKEFTELFEQIQNNPSEFFTTISKAFKKRFGSLSGGLSTTGTSK
ncbi:unnamed protein product [Leptidea sinapis]|uniref:Uncharacterized protein n=1 Tax=Leptidea sinapis TaxID=189913 RepID=A0A5E4QUP7_9NEOP|nr:unnamed protein product [Leptidea sinapis]